jgi:hypothetical protein
MRLRENLGSPVRNRQADVIWQLDVVVGEQLRRRRRDQERIVGGNRPDRRRQPGHCSECGRTTESVTKKEHSLFKLRQTRLPRSVMSAVSFTVRRPSSLSSRSSDHPSHRPSPLSRTPEYSREDDDDDDDENDDDSVQDELVTGFDAFGVQRSVPSLFSPLHSQLTQAPRIVNLHSLHKPNNVDNGPLVIPMMENRDWREMARKRRSANQYVPASAAATTGPDGSVGGLGTRDSINSGPALSGLQVKQKRVPEQILSTHQADSIDVDVPVEEQKESEDEIALKAVLAGVNGDQNTGPAIDLIPPPVSEADAYKQDVDQLPNSATLDDYARVPVAQFGAALLRGMGWKEGTAASRKPGKGLVQPYLPEARPALLGIGAKEQEVYDDGSKKRGPTRPEKRYVPVIKRDRDPPQDQQPRSRQRSTSPTRSSSRPSTPSARDRRDKYTDDVRDRRDRYSDDSRDKRDRYENGRDRRDRYTDDDRRDRDRYERDRDDDRRRYRDRSRDRDSGRK